MTRPYELTEAEISKIVSDNYNADPWNSGKSAAREAEIAAQKKLLEYMADEGLLDHGDKIDDCATCQILKDFGL